MFTVNPYRCFPEVCCSEVGFHNLSMEKNIWKKNMQWSHLVSLGNGSVGVKTFCYCERYLLKKCIKKEANIWFAHSYTPILKSLYDFSSQFQRYVNLLLIMEAWVWVRRYSQGLAIEYENDFYSYILLQEHAKQSLSWGGCTIFSVLLMIFF